MNYLKNNMLTDFKKYLQSLSLPEQIYAINDMSNFISTANIDINKKFSIIKELKEIRQITAGLINTKNFTLCYFLSIKNSCTQIQHNKYNI